MDNKRQNILGTKRVFVLAGILTLLCAGGIILFARKSQPGNSVPGDQSSVSIALNTDLTPAATGTPDQYGIDIELSDGQPGPQPTEALPVATGEPLLPEEIQGIFARLPSLPLDPNDQTAFNLPQEVLPPPRPGNTIKETFPPLDVEPPPGSVDTGPLQVVRFAPQGEIPIAPFVSVTFNQPMVPLGTISDLAAGDVPVTLEPSLPGTWRWLGTKTLAFEYDSNVMDRLPMATEYRVTVPAGTKSASGKELAEAVSWTFKTPPPKIVASYPDFSPQPLDPIFFIAFDQQIDPQAVLRTIQVRAGSQNVDIALVSQTDIDADPRISQWAKDTPDGRWLAFRATKPLPPETGISVSVGPGTPSKEGPLTTTETQSYDFSTYAPLRIEEQRCTWSDNICRPLNPFYIRFNNPLDSSLFSEDLLRVEPAIPGVSANL